MPSARRVAKDILEALDKQIIPTLQQQVIPIGCATLPFDFPPEIKTHLVSRSVPRGAGSDWIFGAAQIIQEKPLHLLLPVFS